MIELYHPTYGILEYSNYRLPWYRRLDLDRLPTMHGRFLPLVLLHCTTPCVERLSSACSQRPGNTSNIGIKQTNRNTYLLGAPYMRIPAYGRHSIVIRYYY